MTPIEKEFEQADTIIQKAYPDIFHKGRGWWGEQRIPNYGILCQAIAEAHSRQEERVERLKNGLNEIPYGEYGEALREGCDPNGAWECFVESCGRHVRRILGETK